MKPAKVLLVEDSPQDVLLIRSRIDSGLGAAVVIDHVVSIAAAKQAFARGGIEVVILDLCLPDNDGLSSIQAIRAIAPEIPIVVCTGNEDERTYWTSQTFGNLHFVRKTDLGALVPCVAASITTARRKSEEHHSVERRLDAINSALQHTVTSTLRPMVERVEQHHRTLYGDPESSEKDGLVHGDRDCRRHRDRVNKGAAAALLALTTTLFGWLFKAAP